MNNELSEHLVVSQSGVLPMRRHDEYPVLRARDPAFHGMTDFTRTFPITVAPERPIDAALSDMIRLGVRALLVVSDAGVIGLITSYDIERHGDGAPARVADVMTHWKDVLAVDWVTMQSARIADLLDMFRGIGVMHLLVIEGRDGYGVPTVRGLVSRTRIESRLAKADGMPEWQKVG